MDSFDLNTRLPPRKRLLAGLRKESAAGCDFALPLPPISTGQYARLRDLFNSANSSPEEIVEASRSAALAAAEVATRARATATEKAAAASKARAAARSAMELLDSVARYGALREGRIAKNKLKKKHVPINLLYKKKLPGKTRKTDEELAHRLHRTMNSSPRFSDNSQKKRHSSEKPVISDDSSVCNGNSPVSRDGEAQLINGHCVDKCEEKVVVGGTDKGTVGIKKVKGKPKRVLLSQCNSRDQGKPRDETLTKKPKLDDAVVNMPLDNTKPSCGGEVPMKIPSVWKCKKIKVSLQSSDSKISNTPCSDPAVPKVSNLF